MQDDKQSDTQPTTSISDNEVSPGFTPNPVYSWNAPIQRQSKWRYLFRALSIFQFAGIGLFLLVMIWASAQAKAGVSGTEFIALILFVTVVPAVALISLIKLIGLPIYIAKAKPHGKSLTASIVSLAISAMLVLYGGFNAYAMYVLPRQLSQKSTQRFEQQQKDFAAANAHPEITKDEAIQLLESCQLKGFYYTNQTDKHDPAMGGWGELSSTGVVLTKVDGKPYRISIADKLIPELVPIAREAQSKCGGPQFWHDGSYEQFHDGNWYFGNQVVSSAAPGKTKADAISFMQSCKADYFVGYTDINLVKDLSTREWLQKAEQSSSGIEISDTGSKTYVFASKAMTTELQDMARQYRQSCYNTRKLYVAIDNWIETEYPKGSWTRVNQ